MENLGDTVVEVGSVFWGIATTGDEATLRQIIQDYAAASAGKLKDLYVSRDKDFVPRRES